MRPRILIVSHGLRIGGVERSLLGLMRALPPEECELSLFLHSHDGEWVDRIPPWVRLLPASRAYEALDRPISRVIASRDPGIGVARLLAKAVTSLRRRAGVGGFLLPRSVRYALPFLPDVPGDYDLAIGFLAPHDVVSKRVRARRRHGWVHTDYSQLETGVDLAFESRAWTALDGIVAVSSDVARTFRDTFGLPTFAVRVIENVLDVPLVRAEAAEFDALEEMEAAPSTLRLCSVGRFSHAKGYDVAIDACARLLEEGLDVKWFLVGYGSEERSLAEQIARRGIGDRFVILGRRRNPYPYIATCDVFVQPSRYEGKAVTVREAQALGRAVVVSPYPTAASQLEDGVDGLVAEPGADGLAATLARLLRDRALREAIASAAASRDYGNSSGAREVLDLARAAASGS